MKPPPVPDPRDREHLDQVRRLDALRDEFVALVSQELRTPLTSVRGYLDLVLDGSAGELNAEQSRFLAVAARNCGRLELLVEDLLLIAHAQAGRLTLDWADADLEQLARSAVDAARPGAEERGVEIVLVTVGRARLLGDAALLGRLLDSLLTNAITFTPGGGSVEVRVRAEGGVARLEIADSADHLQLPGAGLGPAVSKAIAEAHGGTIDVEERPGAGTTFRVTVPTHLDKAEPEQEAA